MYTLLYCKTGAILQSVKASEDRAAYSANFEKFKRDSKNQIAAKSTNDFSRSNVDKIVTYWYNQKGRRLNQGKRKKYKKPNSSKKSRDTFGLTISCWILMMIVRLTMIRMTLVQMKTMHTFFTMLSKFYSDDHL